MVDHDARAQWVMQEALEIQSFELAPAAGGRFRRLRWARTSMFIRRRESSGSICSSMDRAKPVQLATQLVIR